ncbi:hypothetical protein WOC76_01260 [Methylocystis sp. IM3]
MAKEAQTLRLYSSPCDLRRKRQKRLVDHSSWAPSVGCGNWFSN